jgi:hypothetical protein
MGGPDAEITVERRGQIAFIGINRPQMFNRIDPKTFYDRNSGSVGGQRATLSSGDHHDHREH